MARITNANILRLGTNLPWLSSSASKPTFALFSYLPYYIERLCFYQLEEEDIVYGPGSLVIKTTQQNTLIFLSFYSLKAGTPGYGSLPLTFLPSLKRSLTSSLLRISPRAELFLSMRPLTDLDSAFVLSYFKLRTFQGFTVVEILRSLHKLLSVVPGIVGYRIDVTGRYARQQRASKLSIKKGLVTLSQLSANICYIEDFIILKHGKCGFKIWLNRLPGFAPSTTLYY